MAACCWLVLPVTVKECLFSLLSRGLTICGAFKFAVGLLGAVLELELVLLVELELGLVVVEVESDSIGFGFGGTNRDGPVCCKLKMFFF